MFVLIQLLELDVSIGSVNYPSASASCHFIPSYQPNLKREFSGRKSFPVFMFKKRLGRHRKINVYFGQCNAKKLDGVAPLITDPPPTSFTTL